MRALKVYRNRQANGRMRLAAALLALVLGMSLSGACLAEAPAADADANVIEASHLILTDGDAVRADLEVCTLKGYEVAYAMIAAPDEELYFVPTDEKSPVRFLYYTIGRGDPAELAAAAVESYTAFYDVFDARDIARGQLDGREIVQLDYTCAYPGRDGVTTITEKTCIRYIALEDDIFVACILSLASEDPDSLWAGDRLEHAIADALEAIQFPAP